MLAATLVVDEAVGETRRVLLDADGRPFRLDVERWSEAASRVRFGEIWAGRLISCERDGDWFVDLGPGGRGLMRSRQGAAHHEGERVALVVRSEARTGKAPRVEINVESTSGSPDVSSAGRVLSARSDPLLQGVTLSDTISDDSARSIVDGAMDEALSSCVQGVGGAQLWIEATRAVTAIDVDGGSGGRRANAWAAHEAARQIALRGVGGLLVIDFAGSPKGRPRDELAETFRSRAEVLTGRRVDSLGISRFGLLQASLPHSVRPIMDAMVGVPEGERGALDGLRRIESMGRSNRGKRVSARLPGPAVDWLNANDKLWETALADRIGRRWSIEASKVDASEPDVWSAE